MEVVVIEKKDQYVVDGTQLFKMAGRNGDPVTYRDVYIDLAKNPKSLLYRLAASFKIPGRSKMSKDELLAVVSARIQFE